jgi:hypothetical protein
MDLMREIRAAQDRSGQSLLVERRLRNDNLNSAANGPSKRSTKLRLVEAPTMSKSFESALVEKTPDSSVVVEKKPGWLRRLRSKLRKWWYGARKGDTHRFRRLATVKVFDHVPTRIKELYEEDERGRPIEHVRFEKVDINIGTTCRLISILMVGLLVVELDEDEFAVVGLDDIEKL